MRGSKRLTGVLVVLAAALAPSAASAATDGGGVTVPTPGAVTRGIAEGADGNVWFTESVGDKIGTVNPFNTVFEHPLPHAGSEAWGIARGPDGNVWFAERAGNRIGRMTPAGAVTEFALPTANSKPREIALGPDHNLWFTEERGAIGRITPAGAITEYPLPAGYTAYDIAAGPDGKLWFTNTDATTASIGKLDPASGAMTHYRVLSTHRVPYDIAPGPDNAMWFSAAPANIGRITSSGSVKLFPRVTGHVEDLVTGADGNIWFTEPDAKRIGHMTTQGAVTEEPTPSSNSSPFGIAVGGWDGNTWYTTASYAVQYLRVVPRFERHTLCRDAGCAPGSVESKQGTLNRWSFYGPHVHRVTDSSGLGLFDSGPKPAVSFYSATLTAAGTYRWADPADPSFTGKVLVPVIATPSNGSATTTFTVTWASAPPAAGRVYDVQIRRPGSTTYFDWKMGTTATSATFVPDAGNGGYYFRARLREPASGKAVAYSQGQKIGVGP